MSFPQTAPLNLLICVAALFLLLFIVREIRRARLACVARASIPPGASDEDAVLCLASEVFLSARRRRDSPGSRPHVLYIALLDAIGIRATAITLYRPGGSVDHDVVDVELAGGSVIVDVESGFSYRDFWGDRLGLQQLQQGLQPWFQPLPALEATVHADDRYYELDFSRTTAATGSGSAVRRLANRLLRALRGAALKSPVRLR